MATICVQIVSHGRATSGATCCTCAVAKIATIPTTHVADKDSCKNEVTLRINT